MTRSRAFDDLGGRPIEPDDDLEPDPDAPDYRLDDTTRTRGRAWIARLRTRPTDPKD